MIEPLAKITERTELVPELDRLTAYNLLVKFRTGCLEKEHDISAAGVDIHQIDQRFGVSHDSTDLNYDLRLYALTAMGLSTRPEKPVDCIIELLLVSSPL